jgi:glycosyltransferase involved in cell wall biosynthesis
VQRRLTPGVPVEVVPGGIDVAAARAWHGSGSRLRRGLGGPLVGIVGRLDPMKGQDDFLRAAALLDPSTRFAVVGGAVVGHEGDLPERLRALASELGIADRVTFTGHVEDPLRWFDALDVAVIASHHEAFGLVCVEALALGTPVVATTTDGPSEILRGGLLVPPQNPEALAAAVAQALRGEGRFGPERADEYDVAVAARRMAAVLSGARSAGAGSGGGPAVPAAHA